VSLVFVVLKSTVMKCAAALVLAALASPAAAQAPASGAIQVSYSEFTLLNGLRFILH